MGMVLKAKEVSNGNGRPPLSPIVSTAIALVVTIVWAASFLADIVVKDYDPNPLVHFIMLAVVGAAFGHSVLRNGKGGS